MLRTRRAGGRGRGARERGVSTLASLSADFTIDLVQVESAAPGLRRAIEQQGQVLNPDGANFQTPESANGLSRGEPEMTNYGVLFGQIEHELIGLVCRYEEQRFILKREECPSRWSRGEIWRFKIHLRRPRLIPNM